MRSIRILSTALVLYMPVTLIHAKPLSHTMAKPKDDNDKEDKWKISKKGKSEVVKITIIKGDTPNKKAENLYAAIRFAFPEDVNRFKLIGAKVILPKEYTGFEKTVDGSKEKILGNAGQGGGNGGKGMRLSIGYDGVANGIDIEGGPGPSVFETSFGYDGFAIATTINYADLGTPDAEAVLTAMYSALYAQLPPTMQPDLTLDLVNRSIIFELDDGHRNYFVTNDTNDATLEMRGGVEVLNPLPEPSTCALALFCAAGVLARARLSVDILRPR